MNLHSLAFLALFALFSGLIFVKRSSWGVPLYMLTLYASPLTFGWAWALRESGVRWTLLAALIFAVGVLMDSRPKLPSSREASRLLSLLFIYALNATAVHLLFASNPEKSGEGLDLLWKQVGLCCLMIMCMREPFDLKLMLYSLLLGAGYLCYEIVRNDSGAATFDGRTWPRIGGLFGNHVTAILGMTLPVGGYFFFCGTKKEKFVALACTAFILEVVLRANSRGTFLGLLAGATWFLVLSRGRARAYVAGGIVLGIIATFATLDEEDKAKVFGRFGTTFVESERRDASAASRLDYWNAGVKMISEHPFGSGAEAAFESDLGAKYVRHLDIEHYHDRANEGYRSVHNGYLDTTASWGIQGFLLFSAAFLVAFTALWSASAQPEVRDSFQATFLGNSLQVMIVLLLVTSMFGSNLKSDGMIWFMAMAIGYSRLAPQLAREEARRQAALPAPAQLTWSATHSATH